MQNYNLQSEKIKTGDSIKIVVISDTHSQIFEQGGKRIIDKVKNEKPDFIFLTGDIIDNKLPLIGSKIFLYNIQNIAPIYYVPGNHEYYNRNIDELLAVVKNYGIMVLQDIFIEIELRGNKIIIAGADDPARKKFRADDYDWQAASEQAFSALADKDGYKILLVHRPDHAAAFAKYTIDLMLSGHTHGGQIRFPPFINGLYAPGQGLFPQYPGGQYQIDSLTLIISRGLTTERPRLPRLNNPPEIVVVEITGIDDP